MRVVKIGIKIFLAIAFLFFFACEDQSLVVKCPDCLAEEPTDANLEIKLDANRMGGAILINIYEGNIEDSILYNSIQTSSLTATLSVKLNKKYTATATYYVNDNYYVAIDSATPRVRFDKTQCDDPCYFVYDKKIDLRLKYTK